MKMSRQYEQKVTITLTQDQATAIGVALDMALEAWRVGLKTWADDTLTRDHSNAHPTSAVGIAQALSADLRKVSLGNKSTKMASYEMVRIRESA
jgi:predicted DNA-binding transcriptional regulator YafY